MKLSSPGTVVSVGLLSQPTAQQRAKTINHEFLLVSDMQLEYASSNLIARFPAQGKDFTRWRAKFLISLGEW